MTNLRSSIAAVAPLALLTLLALPLQTVDAQVRRLPGARSTQATWISASGSLIDLQSFHGAADGGEWNWGDGVQLRGSIERGLRPDMTLGIAGSYARLPLTVTGGTCSGCRSEATVWTTMGVLRLGGGGNVGFHSAFEASAGVAGFASFKHITGGAIPDGPSGDLDAAREPHRTIVPAIAAAYGVGYTLNPGLELSLVQEIGIFIYGASDNAPSGTSSTPRFSTTRLTLRYALGR